MGGWKGVATTGAGGNAGGFWAAVGTGGADLGVLDFGGARFRAAGVLGVPRAVGVDFFGTESFSFGSGGAGR